MPRIKPFQTFLSHRAKALSPSSSWARTVVDAPAASKTMPTAAEPDAMLEIVAAERCHHRPLDTTTLTCQAISPSPQTSALCPGSGHFCGAVPHQEFIQQSDHPGNDGRIGQVEHVPFEAEACGSQVQQDEIRHRAVGHAGRWRCRPPPRRSGRATRPSAANWPAPARSRAVRRRWPSGPAAPIGRAGRPAGTGRS